MSYIKPGTAYLPNLTPLRGIAALLTVIYHADLYLGAGGGRTDKDRRLSSYNKAIPHGRFLFCIERVYYVPCVW